VKKKVKKKSNYQKILAEVRRFGRKIESLESILKWDLRLINSSLERIIKYTNEYPGRSKFEKEILGAVYESIDEQVKERKDFLSTIKKTESGKSVFFNKSFERKTKTVKDCNENEFTIKHSDLKKILGD